MRTLPIDTLHRLLICDAEAGKLYWRVRGPEWFSAGNTSAELRCAIWNARYAGKEALYHVGSSGYSRGAVLNINLQAHRVIWAMHYGRWPSDQIDHINGIRSENRISNLREVTARQNKANCGKRPRRSPSSKFIGVQRVKATGRWGAAVGSRWVGTFRTQEEAARARDALALQINGPFARLNFPEASNG